MPEQDPHSNQWRDVDGENTRTIQLDDPFVDILAEKQ